MTDLPDLRTAPGPEPVPEILVEPVEPSAPATRGVDPPMPRSRRRTRAVLLLGILPLLGVGAVAGGLVAWDAGYEARILPGVHVGRVDLSGMDGTAAAVAIEAAYPVGNGRIILRGPDADLEIPFADMGRRLDTPALVAEAMASGRAGGVLERAVAEVRQALTGVEIPPRALIDEAATGEAIAAALATFDRPPVDATITMGPDGPRTTPAQVGRTVVAAPVVAAALEAVAPLDAADGVVIEVTPIPVAPAVDARSVGAASAAAERMVGDVQVTFRDQAWTIRAARVRSWIGFEARGDGTVIPVVDPAIVATALTRPTKAVLKAPVNAQYLKGRGGRVVGVVASRNGRELDPVATASRIVVELEVRALAPRAVPVPVAITRTLPRLTTEEARKSAPVMTRLGKWTTYFPISDRNYFGANIWRPAEIIDGTVLSPGETFEWWKAIWPVTTARGFGPGGFIAGNHTEPTGALGGGMCSSSTTLFNAAMRAGLKMGARANHRYYISRYPLGLDATVSISAGGGRQTMSFTNDTGHKIVIRGIKIRRGSSGYVRYEIWGIPDGRTVSISAASVANVSKATTSIVYVDSLPTGVREQTEYPSNGMSVSVTRLVRNAKGRIIHRDTWFSRYVLWNGRIEIGR